MTDEKTKTAAPLSSVWLRLIAGLYAAALLSYIGLGLFSRMMADDFCTAALGLQLNPLGATQHWYLNWSGLYTNFFVKSAIAALGPLVHAFLTGLFILGLLAVLWWVLRDVLRWYNIVQAGRVALLVSGMLTFGIVDGAVSRQPIFWAGALIPYSLPLILLVGALGLAFRLIFMPTTNGRSRLLMAAFALLVFLNAGFSEVYAVYQGALWGMLLLIGTVTLAKEARERLWRVMGVALVVASIGLLIVLASPGNALRREVQDQSLMISSLYDLASAVLQFTVSIFASETYGIVHFFLAFFASFMLWAAAIRNGQDAQGLPAPHHLGRAFLLSFLIAFGLIIVAVTPPMYGAGLVTARSLMAVRFTQIILFALWGYWAAVGFARSYRLRRVQNRSLYRLVQGAILAMLVIIPAIVLFRHVALFGDFATYASQWDARHAAIHQARERGETTFVVVPLDYNMEEYLSLDRMEKAVSLNGEEWTRGCAESYYGITLSLLHPPQVVSPDA